MPDQTLPIVLIENAKMARHNRETSRLAWEASAKDTEALRQVYTKDVEKYKEAMMAIEQEIDPKPAAPAQPHVNVYVQQFPDGTRQATYGQPMTQEPGTFGGMRGSFVPFGR